MNDRNKQNPRTNTLVHAGVNVVRLIGIEPTHPAPEAGALSTELQARVSRFPEAAHTIIACFLKNASLLRQIQKNQLKTAFWKGDGRGFPKGAVKDCIKAGDYIIRYERGIAGGCEGLEKKT